MLCGINIGGESYIEESLLLAFPSIMAEESRFVVVLHGYFDDSGTHEGSSTVVVAGYLARPANWVSFEIQWKAALSEWGIDHFGMADFSNKAKLFRSWTEEERQSRFQRLVTIINSNVLGSLGTAIPVDSFHRIMSEKAKRVCGGAYGLAATICFMSVAKKVKMLSKDAWVAYIFESGTRGAGEILKFFQENERDEAQKQDLRLLSLRFENKRQFVPLQAADIVAYELYRQLPKQRGKDPRPPRLPILRQLIKAPRDWGAIDDNELKKWNSVLSLADEKKRL